GSSTDEGTGSKPGVPDVPSNDSEEEILWNSSDDKDVNAQDKDSDDDEEEEIAKIDEPKDTESARKKGYMKRKRQMNFTVTSILTRERDYKYLKILKTLT
nr:hypothetical protein [Tanacetum cinerariifolium]